MRRGGQQLSAAVGRRMTDDKRSMASTGTDSSAASEAEEVEKSARSRKSSAKSIAHIRKSVSLLDSNGESDDEEINKLQKIIQDQAKELNEERSASKKLRQMVRLLKRETKQLQLKQQQNQQQNQQQTKDSDSEAPPWEKRKLEARLADIEKMILEKNAHIEQLLRDCRSLERENQECNVKIQELSQQFAECTQQLQIATQNYETLEETYKDRIVQLESDIDRTRIQLDECQLQKEMNEENLDKISDAVDFTINKCREIITSKERTIEMLEARLQSSPGKMAREEEVERLRDELSAAAKEIEESARLIEQFQSLPVTGSASISASVKRKLKELESIKETKLDNERLLAERDEQVADLTRLVHRYESGAYGLGEATRELRDVREQVRVRDAHIERLVEQLNSLEERLEDIVLENNDLRKTCGIEENRFDVPLARVTLTQQIDEAKEQVERLKGENMQLGLENRSLKRALLKSEKAPSPIRPPSVNEKLLTDYQKACSEVIVLRKGLVEILHSVREQDGSSDVKIESPILERLVSVLNSERLFGHYDAYVDLMNENSSVHGENRALRERIRELKSAPPTPTPRTAKIDRATSGEHVTVADQAVQVVRDVSDAFNNISIDLHGLGREEAQVQTSEEFPTPEAYRREADLVNELKRQVLEYEHKLNELERQLGIVRVDLIELSERHETSSTHWHQQERNLVDEISRKDVRVEELETELAAIKDISMHEKSLQVDDSDFNFDTEQRARQKSVEIDEEKIQMEKEMTTLKVRLEHKEKTLRRAQEFLDEVRLEQLKLIEDHSQEVLNLQETILEQQRALHRIEQAQREMAASAASNRAVVRHLETEVDSSHQLHARIAELTTQLETVRKQAQQWKQAAEMLSKEKQLLRDSLKADHDLEIDELKRNIKANEDELEEFRAKTSQLQRQLTEERIDKQRGTLLQVLVAKLKSELDRKEKQMALLKQIAEEMNARLEMNGNQAPLVTSTPVPAHNAIPIPSPSNEQESMSKSWTELEQRHAQLEKAAENQRKLLESSHNRERTLKEQLKEQTGLVDKLQDEKAAASRQLVALRNRVTRMSNEKAAAQTTPDDVCRLLKRIKELEGQLAMFHTAEKPAEEPLMLAKSLAMDQWKERKKMQTVLDQLKVKSKELEQRLRDEERSKDSLRKTINRLVNEKRSLEDKLKFKANDNERIRLLVQENTQWRLRFEGLEDRLREMERLNDDEDSQLNRHRLQIAVLQERIRKQDAQLQKTPGTSLTSTNGSTNVSITSEDAIAKFKLLNNVEAKLKENIQRLANLVQLPRSGSDRRIAFQEEPPMADIRRTVRVLHQLVHKLSYIKDNSM